MALDRRYVYVNIYNKGIIPLIFKNGPIFGMGMNYRFYEKMKMIPGIMIYTIEEDRDLRSKGVIPGSSVNPSTASPKKSTQPVQVAQSIKAEDNIHLSDVDLEIARKAKDIPLFDDQDISLSEKDMAEIKEAITSRVYTRYELGGFSNSKLKYILNVERKNEPGSKYYGAFHDRKPKLVEYILATQDPLPDEEKK
jgi:hypothetical protein